MTDEMMELSLKGLDAGVREFARHLLRAIPPDGKPIGNHELRRRTGTLGNKTYWDTRDALVEAGLLGVGGGRGGSVRLIDPECMGGGAAGQPFKHGLELSMYAAIRAQLEIKLKDEARFDHSIVSVTGVQGKKQTGGPWTRPDVTAVGGRRMRVLGGLFLEVQTYEVKTSASISIIALHEARNHGRCAHRSSVLFKLEQQTQERGVEDLASEAANLGVGLISFVDIQEPWHIWVEPPLAYPDPVEVDRFLDLQLDVASKAIIASWHAVSTSG